MAEDKPAPKTKEELISMLKQQLDQVEVHLTPCSKKSTPCRTPSRMNEIREKNSPRNSLRRNRKFRNLFKIKPRPWGMYLFS